MLCGHRVGQPYLSRLRRLLLLFQVQRRCRFWPSFWVSHAGRAGEGCWRDARSAPKATEGVLGRHQPTDHVL